MITDINELMEQCMAELVERNYSETIKLACLHRWNHLRTWMESNSIASFSEEVAKTYCEATFGMFLLKPRTKAATKRNLRAVRLLVCYQKDGDFESRTPSSDHSLSGGLAPAGYEFLDNLSNKLYRAKGTVEKRQWGLYLLCRYMQDKSGLPKSLSWEDVDGFLKSPRVQETGFGDICITMRQFLRFIHQRGYVEKDLSILVPTVTRKKHNRLPTTYSDEEVKRLLEAVERSSAKGKRDYVVLLLASEFGLRASDIRTLAIDEIDWDDDVIEHRMEKTKDPLRLPLIGQVGNAILDYLQNGRPDSKFRNIVVSHAQVTEGRPLSSQALHSIVAKYMKKASIKDWQKQKARPPRPQVLGGRQTAGAKHLYSGDCENPGPSERQCHQGILESWFGAPEEMRIGHASPQFAFLHQRGTPWKKFLNSSRSSPPS